MKYPKQKTQFPGQLNALCHQKLNVEKAQPQLVDTASADEEITHSPDDCDKYLFRLLSQAYVDDHNSRRSSIDNDLTITDANDKRAFQHQNAIKAEVLLRGRSSGGTYIHGDVL